MSNSLSFKTSAPASALPRPLDPGFSSNRAAMLGLGLGVLSAKLLGHSWAGSLRVGLGTFGGWAIARELDPDHSSTALTAMPLAFAALLGRPADTERGEKEAWASLRHALPAFTALSGLRTVAATVGPLPSRSDVAALSVQAGAAALSSGSVTSLLPGAALMVSAQLGDALGPPNTAPLSLAAAALPTPGRSAGSSVIGDLLSLAALGLGAVMAAPENITSRCDTGSRPLSAQRIRAARLLGLGTLGLGLLRRETRSLAPLAAACLGVGLRRATDRP